MLDCCIAEIFVPTVKNVTLPLIAALWSKRLVQTKCRQTCNDYVVIMHFMFKLNWSVVPSLQRTRRPDHRCRRIQMSDEVMSLFRCSDDAVLTFNMLLPRVLCLVFLLLFFVSNGCVLKSYVVHDNFTVCPSVPETLNLWGQSRSQVRSSGTGLHSVSTAHKKNHFIEVLTYSSNIFSRVICFYWMFPRRQENPPMIQCVSSCMSIHLLSMSVCLSVRSGLKHTNLD